MNESISQALISLKSALRKLINTGVSDPNCSLYQAGHLTRLKLPNIEQENTSPGTEISAHGSIKSESVQTLPLPSCAASDRSLKFSEHHVYHEWIHECMWKQELELSS